MDTRTIRREILACAFVDKGNLILAGTAAGQVLIVKSGTNEIVKTCFDKDLEEESSSVTALKKNKKLQSTIFLATYSMGKVKYWDWSNGQCVRTINENQQIHGLAIHPKDTKFITCGDDARLRLYDMETGQLIMTFENSYKKEDAKGHSMRVFAAKFHPKRDSEFISGGWDNTVHFWDIRSPHSKLLISGPHICGEGLDIDQSGEQILTCSYQSQKSIALWSYDSAQAILDFAHEEQRMYCGKWIGPKHFLAGSSDPAFLKLYNIINYQQIDCQRFSGRGVYSIDSFVLKQPRRDSEIYVNIACTSGAELFQFEVQYPK